MYKTYSKIIYALIGVVLIFTSCGEDDKISVLTVENTQAGGILRTLNNINDDANPVFDMFRVDNEFEVVFEYQDDQNGGLLERVDFTIAFDDNNRTSAGAADDQTVNDVAFGSIAASEFTTSDNGLPQATFDYTMAEAITATGISLTDILPGDQFILDLEVFLTDGRSFSADDASGNISGGSFFSSPYQYISTVQDGVDFDETIQLNRDGNPGIHLANATGINLAESEIANNFDLDVIFAIDDMEEGAQLQTLNVYREFVDRSIGEDMVDLSEDEMLFETFEIANLMNATVGTGDDATIIKTFQRVYTLDELFGDNLDINTFGLNDEINLRYELITADGRIITTTSPGTEYYLQIVGFDCVLLNADSVVSGTYTIRFADSFGDGWDGAEITVSIDEGPATGFTILTGSTGDRTFTVPAGTTSLVVSYVAGDFEEEHSYMIFAPNGFEAAADGPNPRVGPINLAVCDQ